MSGRMLERDEDVRSLLQRARRVVVLGIKTEAQAGQPAFDVPEWLKETGYDVVPVPVYYPDAKEILGVPVFRRVADVPRPVDLVNVFRRPSDIDAHVEDIIASGARAAWFQLGIRNDAAAKRLVEAGIDVVQDRCILVEHRRLMR